MWSCLINGGNKNRDMFKKWTEWRDLKSNEKSIKPIVEEDSKGIKCQN